MHPFSTTLGFSDDFRGYRKGALGTNGLTSVTMGCVNGLSLISFSILEIQLHWGQEWAYF